MKKQKNLDILSLNSIYDDFIKRQSDIINCNINNFLKILAIRKPEAEYYSKYIEAAKKYIKK